MADKTYLTWKDVAERHGLGETNARKRIREIKSLFPNGGDATKGKVMTYELIAWENFQATKALNFERKKK